MPIKHPVCNPPMSSFPTKSETAYRFTHYLVQNRLLNKDPGILPKQTLIQLFEFYRLHRKLPINSYEILAILDEAHLLKKKSIHRSSDKTPYVEFRNHVFEQDLSKYWKFLDKLDPSADDLECKICKQMFTNLKERDEHLITDIHKLRDTYRKERKSFPTKFRNIEVKLLPLMSIGLNESQIVEITLKNVASEPYSVMIHDVFELVHLDGVKTIYTCPRSISNGDIFNLSLRVEFSEYGAKLFPIVLKVSKANSSDVKDLLIEPKFNVLDKELDALGPVAPYIPPSKNKVVFNYADVVKGEYLPSTLNCLAPRRFLQKYPIPDKLNSILNHGFKIYDTMPADESRELNRIRGLLCDQTQTKVLPNIDALTDENYVARFHLLMWIEEHQAHKDMQFYNKLNVELITSRKNNGLFGIEIPGLSEGRPSVLKGDIVYIRRKFEDNVKFEGVVHAIEQNKIFIAPNIKFKDIYREKEKVDIEFTFTRQPLRFCHRALDQLKNRKVTSAMFPQHNEKKIRKVKLKPMFNQLIAENKQQSQAVKNIVENRAYPAPYILFGPPGTGKTATLVEAITQVWSIIPNSRICVCAPSNSAADVITERLLRHIKPVEIMRLYGLSRSDQEIPKLLEKCSNFDRSRKELFIPSEMQIKSKRIVVMTPVTAGRLVTAGINGGFFDYVFMDEAGHAVEVEMLIPIVGFLTKSKKNDLLGSLVLAGDPKQLGPVVRSSLASSLGFDMSLLERVMSQCKIYHKNPEYNPQVITKLINNYRSHKEILHIPNLCFYDNELEAKGPIDVITCASEWKELNDKDFPMIFHGVNGLEEREESSPSYFNRNEMQIVAHYVDNLLGCQFKSHEVTQKDIGIITPYRKQVQRIRKYFEDKNWENIEVASVEEFQGKEKLIIIISTVRSRFELVSTDYQFGLGFLRNSKRFNVALTRAIALLIIIGNPDILQCDPNWRKLIEYCIEKNSYKGVKPSGTVPGNFDPNEKLALDLSVLTVNSGTIPNGKRTGFSRRD